MVLNNIISLELLAFSFKCFSHTNLYINDASKKGLHFTIPHNILTIVYYHVSIFVRNQKNDSNCEYLNVKHVFIISDKNGTACSTFFQLLHPFKHDK